MLDAIELNDMAIMDHERDIPELQPVQCVSNQCDEVTWDRVEVDFEFRRRSCFYLDHGHLFLSVDLGMSPECHGRERTGT